MPSLGYEFLLVSFTYADIIHIRSVIKAFVGDADEAVIARKEFSLDQFTIMLWDIICLSKFVRTGYKFFILQTTFKWIDRYLHSFYNDAIPTVLVCFRRI